MEDPADFSESAKLNMEFRNQIRRKDIDRRLSERRKTFMELHKKQTSQITEISNIQSSLKSIIAVFLANGNKLPREQFKQLVRISCNEAGSLAISDQRQLLSYLTNIITNSAYQQTHQLDLSLLIINNCLTVFRPAPSITSTSSSCSTCSAPSSLALLQLSTSQQFLQRIMQISLSSIKSQIREYSVSIMFDIVYNNDAAFVHGLVVNTKFGIIGVLYNIMQNDPNKSVVIQTLRCFCLVMRKLSFAPYDQFGRMRKVINSVIKNSNSVDLVIIGVICLQSMFRCLNNERIFFSKAGMLPTLISQTLALNNSKLTLNSIRIISMLVENKNVDEIKLIVEFLERILNISSQPEVFLYCYKILYDILLNNLYQADNILENPRIIGKMMEGFYDNSIDHKVLVQICFCLALLGAKSHKMQKEFLEQIRNRIKTILEIGNLSEQAAGFLQQSLVMLGVNLSMDQ